MKKKVYKGIVILVLIYVWVILFARLLEDLTYSAAWREYNKCLNELRPSQSVTLEYWTNCHNDGVEAER